MSSFVLVWFSCRFWCLACFPSVFWLVGFVFCSMATCASGAALYIRRSNQFCNPPYGNLESATPCPLQYVITNIHCGICGPRCGQRLHVFGEQAFGHSPIQGWLRSQKVSEAEFRATASSVQKRPSDVPPRTRVPALPMFSHSTSPKTKPCQATV